jgi:hypothetical protein
MLFKKLKFKSVPGKQDDTEDWYMIIRHLDELQEYLEMDEDLFIRAMLTLNKNATQSHLSAPRERMLSLAYQHAINSATEGTLVWPHQVVQDFVNKKTAAMMKLFLMQGPIQVNEAGGYCTHEAFLKTWNYPTVVAEIEKDSTYFPTDDEAIEADLLFLENAERIDVTFHRQLVGYNKAYDYNKGDKVRDIVMLKEKDPEWVGKCIAKSKAIAIQTEALDDNQTDRMMAMFANEKMPQKKIFLSMINPEVIKSHPLWEACNTKHNIIFL